MEPSSFRIDSPLRPEELRAALSARCREWRWPPTFTSREVGIGRPRIAGGPERFRVWLWPGGRSEVPVLDCRTVAKPGGGCTVHVRMRRSRENQLGGIPFIALIGGLPWAAGWEGAGFATGMWLLVGAAASLYAVYAPFEKATAQRMLRLVETLRDTANPQATSSVRRAS